jgi:hypothetical protein
LLATGLALCSTSILGKIKVVGSINTYSPAVAFFLLAALVELQRFAAVPGLDAEFAIAAKRAVTMAVLLVFVGLRLPLAIYNFAAPQPTDRMEEVYTFSKQHPGLVYFPQFPLSVLLGEKHLYHFAWGLSDRAEAGRPVSGAYFHQYLPHNAAVAGVVEWPWSDEMFRYLGAELKQSPYQELTTFKYYQIRDEPASRGESLSESLQEHDIDRKPGY